jgi:hypothetical protein
MEGSTASSAEASADVPLPVDPAARPPQEPFADKLFVKDNTEGNIIFCQNDYFRTYIAPLLPSTVETSKRIKEHFTAGKIDIVKAHLISLLRSYWFGTDIDIADLGTETDLFAKNKGKISQLIVKLRDALRRRRMAALADFDLTNWEGFGGEDLHSTPTSQQPPLQPAASVAGPPSVQQDKSTGEEPASQQLSDYVLEVDCKLDEVDSKVGDIDSKLTKFHLELDSRVTRLEANSDTSSPGKRSRTDVLSTQQVIAAAAAAPTMVGETAAATTDREALKKRVVEYLTHRKLSNESSVDVLVIRKDAFFEPVPAAHILNSILGELKKGGIVRSIDPAPDSRNCKPTWEFMNTVRP